MLPGPQLPGQTPIDDLSGLRIAGIATQGELNAHEAENIRKVILKYLAAKPTRRSAKFDAPWALKLHAEMFGDVWEWAGRPRTRDLNLGSPAYKILEDVHNLLEDLAAWADSDMPLIEQAVRLHHRAVQIHPFFNGNGRWSRMLANVWLRLHGAGLIEWPETIIGTASTVRNDYIAAVKAADDHDYGPLAELHERFRAKRS